MNLKNATQLFSVRDLKNGVIGLIIVFGGIGLSILTLYAHQSESPRLATYSAVASLVFVLLILIFVVPPLARNAGREAEQMNLPFEFTTGGAIMLGLIVIVGFSAWNTGNNLLFLVLSFLLAAMIVGFFAGGLSLKKLDVKMRFPDTIFAGDKTPILVSLHNRKRFFPSFSVVAEVRGRERERSIAADELLTILPRFLAERFGRPPIVRRTLNHFVRVGRGEAIEVKSDHIFPNRGRLLIKDFELSTRFPFGFFRHRRRLPARETELLVFPQLVPFNRELEDLALDAGNLAANKRGVGQDLLALRDYEPNDDLRRIDWKATARTQFLTVREFSAEDDKRVTIIFDTLVDQTDEKAPSLREKLEAEQHGKRIVLSPRFEAGVSLAASMIGHFSDEQAEIRLVVDGDLGEFGVGRGHMHECLRRLSILEPRSGINPNGSELEAAFERISNERDNSHRFLLTANEGTFAPEIVQQLKIVEF